MTSTGSPRDRQGDTRPESWATRVALRAFGRALFYGAAVAAPVLTVDLMLALRPIALSEKGLLSAFLTFEFFTTSLITLVWAVLGVTTALLGKESGTGAVERQPRGDREHDTRKDALDHDDGASGPH